MNWISYILAFLVAVLMAIQIWWDYLLKHFLKDKRTNDHKILRKRLLILTLLLVAVNLFANIFINYEKDRQASKDKQELHGQINQLSNQLATITAEDLKLREEQIQGFRDISFEFSTNTTIDPAICLAILNTTQNKLSEEQKQLQKSHELFSTEAADLETLRAERENELAIQENQKKQAAVQQEIEDVQKKNDEEEAARRAQRMAENQKWADEELVRREREFADQILPTFEYAIRELDKILAKISHDTGQSRHSDFSGEMPTVYASDLVQAGMIVSGTNTIGVGTNAAWSFKISTSITPLHAYPSYSSPPGPTSVADIISISFGAHYTSINITAGTTNSESSLTIEPYIPWNGDAGGYQFTPGPNGRFYSQVSIKLNVPNGYSILNIDELKPAEDCKSEIDKAVRHLIEAQDKQCPLNLKASN